MVFQFSYRIFVTKSRQKRPVLLKRMEITEQLKKPRERSNCESFWNSILWCSTNQARTYQSLLPVSCSKFLQQFYYVWSWHKVTLYITLAAKISVLSPYFPSYEIWKFVAVYFHCSWQSACESLGNLSIANKQGLSFCQKPGGKRLPSCFFCVYKIKNRILQLFLTVKKQNWSNLKFSLMFVFNIRFFIFISTFYVIGSSVLSNDNKLLGYCVRIAIFVKSKC